MIAVDDASTRVRDVASFVRVEGDAVGEVEGMQLFVNILRNRVELGVWISLAGHWDEVSSISSISVEVEIKALFTKLIPNFGNVFERVNCALFGCPDDTSDG